MESYLSTTAHQARVIIIALVAAAASALPCVAAEAENQNHKAEAQAGMKAGQIRIVPFSSRETSLQKYGIGPFELADKVAAVMAAPAPEGWRPTGIDRNHYLDTAERIVRMAAEWVDDEGRVIDPVIKREHGQTSPRFAAPGAVLLHFGRAGELRSKIFRTMDYCCQALPSGDARRKSPDFWMRELVTAYLALQTVADEAHLQRWAEGLAAVEPEKIYTKVDPEGKNIPGLANWVIYAAGGESMRQAAGLQPEADFLWGHAFYDKYVGGQFSLFTSNGMYRDPNDPLTYDITTRLQVASGLAFGYQGQLREPVEELLRRGGLTLLLFASPEGFCPYGGRSAAFNFREAIIAALCELEARRYKQSNPALAGAFKRQAHLSAISVRRWLDMEPLRHLKNSFHPDTRHGIDTYGNYSVYSLLAASFLSLAAIYADDTIAEAPCPAEKGGFVFELAPAFHKVFANCRGAYLQIDTAADHHHDATGLGRFAVAGVPLELGLGMPFAPRGKNKFLVAEGTQPPAEPTAIGPAWRQGDEWLPLASLSDGLKHALKITRETPQAVEFEIEYVVDEKAATQSYRLEQGSLTIRSSLRQDGRAAKQMRFFVPLLVSSGQEQSKIELAPQLARVTYMDHVYEVSFPATVTATLSEEVYVNRMGKYRSLLLDTDGGELTLTLRLQ